MNQEALTHAQKVIFSRIEQYSSNNNITDYHGDYYDEY